jgi:hypothetical protein
VSPTKQEVDPTGGRYPLAITRTTGTCGWEAGASADWIFLSSNSGSGTDTPTFFARGNSDITTRTASITIAWSGGSATVTVSQVGGCSYTVSPTQESNVLPSGEYKQADIQLLTSSSGGGCSWHATSNADWIVLNATSSHDGHSVLQYRVAANPSGTPRTGAVTVSWPSANATMPTASATITVAQLGACAYSPSPGPTIDVTAAGGQFTVRMTRTSGTCSWKIWNDPAFLSVPLVSGGDGDSFTFTVDRNSAGMVLNYNIYISLGFQTGGGGFREDHVLTIPVRQAAS